MRAYDPNAPKTFGSDLLKAHADKQAPCLISIIVPSHNEEGNLLPLYNELVHVLSRLPYPWELIVVDDGSLDGTWREISMLHAQDVYVKGIRLSRNFGHQYALLAGLSHATGQVLISMDADLQHPPAVIPQLLKEWQAGSKIVHTTRIDPPTLSLIKRLTSFSFYRLFTLLCGVEISAGRADFRLLDRQVADELLALRESDIFFRGLVHWMG